MKFIKFILVIILVNEASLLSVPKKPKKATVQQKEEGKMTSGLACEIGNIEVEDIPEPSVDQLSNWEKFKNWCVLVQALIKIGALKTADYFDITEDSGCE